MMRMDIARKTSLVACLALTFSLMACAAPPPQVADVIRNPTLPPAPATSVPASEPTELPIETEVAGRWQRDYYQIYDLHPDGTVIAGESAHPGEWRMLPDGRIYMKVDRLGEMTATLRSNVMVAGEDSSAKVVTVLRRLDEQGNLTPANILTSSVALPLFDPAEVTSVTIYDSWDGLSPEAPIRAQITLTVSPGDAIGVAYFSKRRIDPISTTVPVTVPAGAMADALALWSQTPVEAGAYKPFISHTDDYPRIRVELSLPDGSVVFETRSQGRDNLPWRVAVNGKENVTYSDLPSTALGLVDPHLARDVQKNLGR